MDAVTGGRDDCSFLWPSHQGMAAAVQLITEPDDLSVIHDAIDDRGGHAGVAGAVQSLFLFSVYATRPGTHRVLAESSSRGFSCVSMQRPCPIVSRTSARDAGRWWLRTAPGG